MFPGLRRGFRRFSEFLRGSRRFSEVLGDSQRFSKILVEKWFFVDNNKVFLGSEVCLVRQNNVIPSDVASEVLTMPQPSQDESVMVLSENVVRAKLRHLNFDAKISSSA